jgi:hypothetical protein
MSKKNIESILDQYSKSKSLRNATLSEKVMDIVQAGKASSAQDICIFCDRDDLCQPCDYDDWSCNQEDGWICIFSDHCDWDDYY